MCGRHVPFRQLQPGRMPSRSRVRVRPGWQSAVCLHRPTRESSPGDSQQPGDSTTPMQPVMGGAAEAMVTPIKEIPALMRPGTMAIHRRAWRRDHRLSRVWA